MTQALSESDVFALLAKRQRRLLLRILRESGPPCPVSELAARISERDSAQSTAEARRAIHLALHHNHLPRLAAADAIEYDPQAATVAPGPNFDRLLRPLERTSDGNPARTDD